MASTNSAMHRRRALSSPQAAQRRPESTTISSSLSAQSATTYTSVAPKTPPTSMSNRSSTACESLQLHAIDKIQSTPLHTCKPALFGFELTIAVGVTKTPRFLSVSNAGDRALAPNTTSDGYQPGRSLNLGEKSIVVLLGAAVLQWLLRSAVEDFVTFITVGFMLWLIFGGYREFAPLVKPSSVDELGTPGDRNVHIEAVTADCVSAQNIASCVESNKDTANESTKVARWLVALPDTPTSVENHTPAQDGRYAQVAVEAEEMVLKTYDTEANATEKVASIAKANSTSQAEEQEEEVLNNLFKLFHLFDDSVDHSDVLLWMDDLPGIFEDIQAKDNAAPNGDSGEDASSAKDDNCDTIREDGSSNGQNSNNTIYEVSPETLAFLLKQHGYPTFNDGDPARPLYERYYTNKHNAIYNAKDTDSCTNWSLEDSIPGRSVMADVKDIDFMFHKIKQRLPASLVGELTKRTSDEVYRSRDRKSGLNVFHSALELYWHIVRRELGVNLSVYDIMLMEKDRVAQHRPACVGYMRNHCGKNGEYRPYLTDKETERVNEGGIDYSQSCHEHGELCQLLTTLRSDPAHDKIQGHNGVPDWLYKVDENDVLDPNAFDPCDCGNKAMGLLLDYRNEKEHGHEHMSSFKSEYPLRCIDRDELLDRRAMGMQDTTISEHDGPPRCQKIVQVCELHEMSTDNIFVLVDTSAEDINDRLKNPGGPLPAPGLEKRSKYPPGFQIKPHLLQIPYEKLAPRCVHGFLHPPSGASCQLCFPNGEHVDCLDCREYHKLRHASLVAKDSRLQTAAEPYQPNQVANCSPLYTQPAHNVNPTPDYDPVAGFRHATHLPPGLPISPQYAADPRVLNMNMQGRLQDSYANQAWVQFDHRVKEPYRDFKALSSC